MTWPLMVPMRQRFDASALSDPERELAERIRARLTAASLSRGESVAVGVGSRGISPLRKVVATVVAELKAAGLRPFIVPAMGSHGGGTAEGQSKVLEEYGISPEEVGAEVRATMDTKLLGHTPAGVEVHGDANAFAADHVVVIARVKPHTSFRADIESGLCKMLAVGLGKRAGAERIHEAGLAATIPEAAAVALATGKVIFGVALVENAYHGVRTIRVAAPDEFHRVDRELLAEARKIMPRLPLERLDLLVVDEMGKDISGTGMDTNVAGMWRRIGGPKVPDYRFLAVLRLTRASEGNAVGIGMADFTTHGLTGAIDKRITYVNALTALAPAMARLPMSYPTEEKCLEAALSAARRAAGSEARIARIKNTLELERFLVSTNVAEELEASGLAERSGDPGPFTFDRDGALLGPQD